MRGADASPQLPCKKRPAGRFLHSARFIAAMKKADVAIDIGLE
jgi:hypothetical protein